MCSLTFRLACHGTPREDMPFRRAKGPDGAAREQRVPRAGQSRVRGKGHAHAGDISVEITGKRLALQTWVIVPKVAETVALLQHSDREGASCAKFTRSCASGDWPESRCHEAKGPATGSKNG